MLLSRKGSLSPLLLIRQANSRSAVRIANVKVKDCISQKPLHFGLANET